MVVFREGEGALQVLPALVDILPEARLNLVIYYLKQGENEEAYELIKDLEPAIPQEYILKRWTIDAKVLQITSNRNLHDNPKERMSSRYRDLCKMFVKIAVRAAESEESYSEAANGAEQLAQNVEKCLKIRVDPDLEPSSGSKGVYYAIF